MTSYENAEAQWMPKAARIGTANMPTIRAEPESPHAFRDLAEAFGEYARASEAFIEARANLDDAKARVELASKVVAEVREKEGV